MRWASSDDVAALVTAADAWWERQQARGLAARLPGFVPADYRQGAAILSWFADQQGTAGRKFLEWGSGLGVMTILADRLGWDAVGIEAEPLLVDEAVSLARRFQSKAQFVRGSFLPHGCRRWVDELDDVSWLRLESDRVYEHLGLGIDDFDLVYVYPWPGEGRLMLEIFERYGRARGWLLSYHGAGEWQLWEKPPGDRPKR